MPPTVIALTGLPGTGKSSFGAMLYPRLPTEFAYLDIDTLTQPLLQAALAVAGRSLPSAAASGELRKLRDAQYACLWNQVRELVAFGRSVLVVAPMTHELEDPPTFLDVVASLRPARFVLLRTHASPAAVRSRLEQRRDFVDEVRLLRWESGLHRYERPVPLPVPGLELDTSHGSLPLLVERALAWLRSQLATSDAAGNADAALPDGARLRA
jgi:predicted kinase